MPRARSVWIGIDDTDSPAGGCTTWVLSELLREARAVGIDLIGEPRLVRLNPNVPWKTRGNAALGARFGRGAGPRRRIGEIDGQPVWSHARGGPLGPAAADAWIDRAWRVVIRSSRVGAPGTDPALVASPRRLSASLYWAAVREVVPVERARTEVHARGATVRTLGDDRGIVGAAAAIAWAGAHPTWELLAYRSEDRIGRPRTVNAASVRRAARRQPGLFLCEDPRTRRLLVAPHTACPILFGLRGVSPEAPLRARPAIRSEPVDRWVLFRTNQGTGDHLVDRPFTGFAPYTAGRWRGTVGSVPEIRSGGHVAFSVVDQDGVAVPCIAFEPTKTLPRIARALLPGDRIRVWGSRASDPTVRLEGLEILALAPRTARAHPPRCPSCGTSTGSLGRQRGYRCARCHRRWPPEAARREGTRTSLRVGSYHPTPSARRHLAPRGPEP